MSQKNRSARAVRELNRVVKTGLVFGSVTSDMAPALIDRYDLLRGVKKLGTWWEWSELFFNNGFDLSMHRRDCTDALWAATLAANKGPGSVVCGLRQPALFVLRQGRGRRLSWSDVDRRANSLVTISRQSYALPIAFGSRRLGPRRFKSTG